MLLIPIRINLKYLFSENELDAVSLTPKYEYEIWKMNLSDSKSTVNVFSHLSSTDQQDL